MAIAWITAAKSIRYKEHESRKHGKKPDRYYVLQFKHNGKVYNEAVGWGSDGVTQVECERVLAVLRENWRMGEGPQTYRELRQSKLDKAKSEKENAEREQSLTLQSIFDGGYTSAQIATGKKSLKAEKILMNVHIIPFFGNTPLQDITPSMMDDFLQHITQKTSDRTGKKLSASSVRYVLAVIRQIWNYALSRKLTDVPYPAKRIRTPNIDNKRTRFLSRDEADKLLEALKLRSQDTHDMALLSLYCGLRAGELFKLYWADINFSEGFIHVRDRKNKESGAAWLTPTVRAMLEARQAVQANAELVFPTRLGEGKAFMSKVFSKVVNELGFNDGIIDTRDKIVFHSLRHTFASWLAQKGVPLHSLAGLMGHKTITMTQRYAHLSPDVQKSHAMLIEGEI